MDPSRSLLDLAADQGGVVTRQQALASGLSRSQIQYRVATGRWTVPRRGVYELFAAKSANDEVRAAVAALPGAVVAAFTAARLHELEPVIVGPDSVLVHTRTTHTYGSVRVMRCHDLRPEHVTKIDGLRVTTIPRTVVDLAPRISFATLCRVVDYVLSDRAVTVDDLSVTLDQVARKGRPGVRVLRTILAEREGGQGMSELERRGLQLLTVADVGAFEVEYPMPWDLRRRFDVAFPDRSLAIEWDGRFWHDTASAFQTDRERDRTALAHGWRVVRFTWDDVVNSPGVVVATIRKLAS